jgi:hypothetical protein
VKVASPLGAAAGPRDPLPTLQPRLRSLRGLAFLQLGLSERAGRDKASLCGLPPAAP